MLRLAADENFNNDIVRGIIRRNAIIDIVRVQDAGLACSVDPFRSQPPGSTCRAPSALPVDCRDSSHF